MNKLITVVGGGDEEMMCKCMQGVDERILNEAGGSAAPSAGVSDEKQAARPSCARPRKALSVPHPTPPRHTPQRPKPVARFQEDGLSLRGPQWAGRQGLVAAGSLNPATISFRWSYFVLPVTLETEHFQFYTELEEDTVQTRDIGEC